MIKQLLMALIAISMVTCEWHIASQSFTNAALVDGDLEGWSFTGTNGESHVTKCGDYTLVGGYGVSGSGAVLSGDIQLPPHYRAKLQVTVFFVDSWDNEAFKVDVDGINVISQQSQLASHTPICGSSSWGEKIMVLSAEFSHSKQNMNLKFSSTLDQGSADESWAIRDVTIFVEECGDNCNVVAQDFFGDIQESELEGWQKSTQLSSYVNDCNGEKYIGGYSKFSKYQLSRTWNDLPTHYKLIVQMKIWQLDSFDGNESVYVAIDQAQYSYKKDAGPYGGEMQCSNSHQAFKDHAFYVTYEIAHTSGSVTVILKDTLDESADNESWGISEFQIFAIGCQDSDCSEISSELAEQSFSDGQGWQNADKQPYNSVTTCGDYSILGGYNTLGKGTIQRTYTDLPDHDTLLFGIEVWFIDTWDVSRDKLYILVDQIIARVSTKYELDTQQVFGTNWLCGITNGNNDTKDEAHLIWIEVPHYSSSANIQLYSNLDEAANNESWGIRNVHAYVQTRHFGESKVDELEGAFTSADGWQVTGALNNPQITDCAGKQVFGGYNTFGKGTTITKTFTGLSAHDYVRVAFRFYFVDSWDNESLKVTVGNSLSVFEKPTATNSDKFQLCGAGNWNDLIKFIEVEIPHNEDSVTVSITTMLDQGGSDESWGINDFHLIAGDYQGLDANKHHFVEPDCVTIYSECNYQGQSLNLCENNPNLANDEWVAQIKSVFIPEGWSADLFNDTDYQGQKHTVEESIPCLEDGPEYQFIQITKKSQMFKQQLGAKKSTVEKNQSHLRSNKL